MADADTIRQTVKDSLPTEPVVHEVEVHIIPRIFLIHPVTGEKIEIKLRDEVRQVEHAA